MDENVLFFFLNLNNISKLLKSVAWSVVSSWIYDQFCLEPLVRKGTTNDSSTDLSSILLYRPDPHISKAAITANQKLGFLKRNLKGCPADLKKMAYLSSVRASLEYAAIIWDPHLDKHKTMLESIQRKAARWIKSDYGRTSSVTAMLQSLRLETLEERRKCSRLTFMYKIMHDLVAVPMTYLDLVRNQRATRESEDSPHKKSSWSHAAPPRNSSSTL